ncbi:heavy metal-associated isoprenylated plant protein 41 [Sorghum bicolor]|uniref:heavy metal-associated isoprenylated plant protein 41 n=1 Tax=Sorghum bicolor TaxID=4558 RepID=UPI000B425707|nr:heavy metal-associated isoprenylated plant protein 41 [Sorghum bicolor]|eukprot:XP_021319282.1 heavy metal-associated isoprenylated plant protein 41 [Sorghum bicolor]
MLANLGSSSSLLQQKTVIRLGEPNAKNRSKAMQLASKSVGVNSVAIIGDAKDQLEVVGESVDIPCLINHLRKKACRADIVVVEEVKDKKKEEEEKKKKEEEAAKKKKAEEEKKKKKAEEELRKLCTCPPPCTGYYGRPLPTVFCEDQPGLCHIL